MIQRRILFYEEFISVFKFQEEPKIAEQIAGNQGIFHLDVKEKEEICDHAGSFSWGHLVERPDRSAR